MANYSKDDREHLAKFGARLRQLRKQQELSQENLAEICNLHRTYIGSAERGERNVSLLNLHRIASALGVDPWLLLASEGKGEVDHAS